MPQAVLRLKYDCYSERASSTWTTLPEGAISERLLPLSDKAVRLDACSNPVNSRILALFAVSLVNFNISDTVRVLFGDLPSADVIAAWSAGIRDSYRRAEQHCRRSKLHRSRYFCRQLRGRLLCQRCVPTLSVPLPRPVTSVLTV